MSNEELLRLKRYSQMFAQLSDSNTTSDSPPLPSDSDAARGGSDPSPPDNNVPPLVTCTYNSQSKAIVMVEDTA